MKKDIKLFINSAKLIIKTGNCSKIGCSICPFYFEFDDIDCVPMLNKFSVNPHKVDWFKQWLINHETTQLEFDF